MRKPSFLVAALIGVASPGAGQTTAYAEGEGAAGPTNIFLSIPVTASVGGTCTFAAGRAPSGTFNQPNFDVTGLDFKAPFDLACSGPSRVAVVSSNGGMKTSGTNTAGYSAIAPYDVTLNLVGSNLIVGATCSAATLVAGSTCAFVGPATTTRGLRLAASSLNQTGTFLRISAAPYTGTSQLVNGTYSDTLLVTVSPSP